MSLIRKQTLSIILVLSLVVGGIPLFFADNAEAAGGVWEKRTSAMSVMHSNGKLTVDVSTFEDEGGKPIQGYTLLLKWDLCRKDLNPLSGFWRTIRDPRTATITTDAKGQAEYKFSISNGCWTENLWVYGSSEGWQNVEYFLGNIASTNIHLDIKTQASMATQHAMQRADTLGIINGWCDMVPYEHETTHTNPVLVYGSKTYAGSAKFIISSLAVQQSSIKDPPLGSFVESPSASVGTIVDYVKNGAHLFSQPLVSSAGTFTYENVINCFGDQATIEGTISNGNLCVTSTDPLSPDVYTIKNAEVNGPEMVISTKYGGVGQDNLKMQVYVNGVIAYPDTGGWAAVPQNVNRNIALPWNIENPSYVDIEIRTYSTTAPSEDRALYLGLTVPQKAELILSDLTQEATATALTLISGKTLTVDLTGHRGEWQISGESSTLTSQDLVPVKAKISSIYPLVISNPRFDKTPIAGTGNGLKFDVYNIRDRPSNETIYLSLIADGDTTVWSTTVGQRDYPAWTNQSQFTTVHLTDITFPADPRKEYDLRITSGGAITEIPVVFYPAEMDPDVIYEPKEDLDEIIADYGTVNAAALKAYHDWAAAMQPRIEAIKSDVQNYTQLFEDRAAMDNLALADAAATRGLELIIKLKEICKGDGSDTSIGELTSHAQGIWSSYQAALLYREAAIAFEAGQDAFGNSTALDAWYQDLVSKRIQTGLDDQKQGDDPSSVAVWVGVAVALVVGGLVMYLAWKYIIPPLRRVLPKGRSPRLRTIRAVTPVIVTIVLAVLIALVAFLATWNIALSIEAALR